MGGNGKHLDPEVNLAFFKIITTLSKVSNLDSYVSEKKWLPKNKNKSGLYRKRNSVCYTIPETALVLKFQEIRQMGKGDASEAKHSMCK